MAEFPKTIEDLELELRVHSRDGRSDAGFRYVIAMSQMGSLAAHFTHDQVENPVARPYGSREGEISDAGHAIVQLMTYCILREIPLQDAISKALGNLREKDFIARQGTKNTRGEAASRGKAVARCYVDPYCENLCGMEPGMILVTNHPPTNSLPYLAKCSGIITNHGGTLSHAAIMSREFKIPCIVGTVDATEQFQTGDLISMEVGDVMFRYHLEG